MCRLFTFLMAVMPMLLFAQKNAPSKTSLCFIENKGQIRDQRGKVRTDVDVQLKGGDVAVFIGDGALHYQFSRPLNVPTIDSRTDETLERAIGRMDVQLVEANKDAQPILQDAQSYYERYYRSGMEEDGILAHSYNSVLYKDIYPGIDWLLYIKDNTLEYEFVVHEGADPKQIKLHYAGASSLSINEDASLTAVTPMGSVREAAPYCYDNNGTIAAKYVLQNNELSFDIAKYNGKLVIDPSVVWGTFYYANTTTQILTDLECASPEEIYMCGYGDDDGLATVGAYQDTLMGLGGVFLVKFDSAGNRLWCTYYADSCSVGGLASSTDGSVYLYGWTQSTDAVATTGCHQPQYGGGNRDCFVVKFTPSGARVWGTYYGGSGMDMASSIHSRGSSIYFTGRTLSASGIASVNGWQTTNGGNEDAFLVKLDTAGNRIWGTYYGGSDPEQGLGVYADGQNNIYLVGSTNSATSIASTGVFQEGLEGMTDAFITKFNADGIRQWGTYYGGTEGEQLDVVCADGAGNVYVAGRTRSDNNIATPGCYQTLRGGMTDIMLGKLTPTGQRIWGSYMGGPNYEAALPHGMSVNERGDIFLASNVDTLSHIPYQGLGAIQDSFGGGQNDGFVSKFDSAGSMQWFTFYGGLEAQTEGALQLAIDGIGNVYFDGASSSQNNITTPGSFQPDNVVATVRTPFLVRIFDTVYTNSVLTGDKDVRSVSFYPNPTNGMLSVLSAESGSCEVYTVDGKLVMRQRIMKGRTNFFLPAGIAHGVYFLKCTLVTGEVVNERVVYEE